MWWKTKRSQQVIGGGVVIAIAGLLSWYFLFRPFVSTDDARVAMTLVRVAPSGVGGRVDVLNVSEGSLVKKGDILAEIDHRVAQANFDKTKTRAQLAQRELERMQRLAREGSATPQAKDVAEANASSAQAEFALATVVLENTYLRSPFNGIVVQKLTEVGNLLEPGQGAVVVADNEHPWIAANIEETSVGAVKPGQTVHVEIDEGGSLTGKVSEVRVAAANQFALIPSDTGAGNFTKVVQRIPIKVIPDSLDQAHLRAGQSVELKIRVR